MESKERDYSINHKSFIVDSFNIFRSVKNADLYTKFLEQSYLSFMKDRASEVRLMGLEKLPVLKSFN